MPSISEILANEDFGQVVSTLCIDTIEYPGNQENITENTTVSAGDVKLLLAGVSLSV